MNQRLNTIKLDKLAYSAFKYAFKKALYDLNYELQNHTGIAEKVSTELLQLDFQIWNYMLEELERGNNATIRIYRENGDGQ